jgi:integrase
MASIAKLPRRRFWFAFYRDATGRQHCKSTKIEHSPSGENPKQRTEKVARNKRLAMDISLKLEEAERGNAVESHLRKVLADISERVNYRRMEFATTQNFLNDWANRAAQTKSPATATRYRGTIKVFLECLGAKAGAALADITPQDVQKFVEARLSGGRNGTTVMVDLKTLNAPFALAMRQGLILSNPVPAADAPKAEKESREPFTWDQVRKLIKAAEGEWKTAVMLGAFTGQRLGDCVSMTWECVDLEAHVLRFRPQKTRGRKRDMILPLHPDLEAHLMDRPSGAVDQPLCPTLSQAPIGGRSGLSRQFQGIMSKAGITQKSIEAGGENGRLFNKFSFHSLRHTYVSQLANAGVAPDVRQLLAGHSDERSHAVYTHTQLATLREAVKKLPNIGP